VLASCNEHIPYAGNHTFPFVPVPYRNLRSVLFQCIDMPSLKSSSQDDALLIAGAWLRQVRSSHREYLMLGDDDIATLPLDWLPDKWEQAIFPHGRSTRMLHRKFFALCVFTKLVRELNSGDVYA
jgi:hypothetical protein